MANTKKESGALRFLYHNPVGRLLLKLLTTRLISKICGAFMNSRLSKPMIGRFIRKNNIDMSQYLPADYTCFNDCFCRKIKPELRPVPTDPTLFVAPCDGLLSVFPIQNDTVLPIKQSRYTIADLLQNEQLAQEFQDGVCLVFRLCVHHYHRYCYPVSGTKGENVFLPGKLHTVRPIALEAGPVFTQNCREYTLLTCQPFGKLVQMEVGAMLVGKIANHHGAGEITRGQEKGMFLYGGSTVVVLLQKDKVTLDPALAQATAQGEETPVIMGQVLSV